MRRAFVEGGGRDVRPAAHPPSFASPKEGGPRKGDPQSASPARPVGRAGAACDARSWGGAAELAAFFELRSNSCGKPDHEVRVSFGTRTHPSPCASRRSQQGRGTGANPAAASQLRLGSVTRAVRAADALSVIAPPRPSAATAHRAERSNGPSGARSHPLLTVPRSAGPGVSACRRTRASSSDSPKLLDRSSLEEGAQGVLRRHPRPEHRRLPPRPRARGTRAAGSPFFWVLFFGEAKNKCLGRRAETRPPPLSKACGMPPYKLIRYRQAKRKATAAV